MQRKQIFLAPITATLLALAFGAAAPDASAQSAGIEDALKKSGEGVGRFRGGVYGSIGWGFGTKINIPSTGGTRPSGFHVEGGGYGLFNPIRDFADIEAGAGISFLTPTSSSSGSGATEYKTGFLAATLYAGPVFRLGNSGSAFGVGAQLLLGNKMVKDSNDAFVKAYPGKMKSTLGVYGEYQYKGDASKAIYFSRLAASRYDATFQGAPATVNEQGKGNTLITLQFGIKY